MSFWNRHLSDDRLAELAHGVLSGSSRRRAVDHLHGCTRCADRHERLVILERALAGGRPHEPSPSELSALREANRAAVMASVRAPAPASTPVRESKGSASRFLIPALSLAFVGVVGTLLLGDAITTSPAAGPSPEPAEFVARGDTAPGSEAMLRVFCARPGETPIELGENQACPEGATLAFSARFAEPPPSLELEVRGGVRNARFSLPLVAEPDEERVLPETVVLEGSGTREVVLTFGTRTLRQTVRVEAAP